MTYIIYSTNEKRNIEEELRMADKVNADLKSYVTLAEENAELRERKRISREIHDTLGHALTGIAAGNHFQGCPRRNNRRQEFLEQIAPGGP